MSLDDWEEAARLILEDAASARVAALEAEVRRLRGLLAEAWAWPDGDYSDAKAKRLYDEIDERVKEALSHAPDCADVV